MNEILLYTIAICWTIGVLVFLGLGMFFIIFSISEIGCKEYSCPENTIQIKNVCYINSTSNISGTCINQPNYNYIAMLVVGIIMVLMFVFAMTYLEFTKKRKQEQELEIV